MSVWGSATVTQKESMWIPSNAAADEAPLWTFRCHEARWILISGTLEKHSQEKHTPVGDSWINSSIWESTRCCFIQRFQSFHSQTLKCFGSVLECVQFLAITNYKSISLFTRGGTGIHLRYFVPFCVHFPRTRSKLSLGRTSNHVLSKLKAP